MVSAVYFGAGMEGWPMVIHGGALSTVIDEHLGRVAIRSFPSRTGVTANLDINFRARVRSGEFYTLHTVLDQARSTSRKAYVQTELRNAAGKLCVDATGVFVVPKQLKLQPLHRS